MQIKNQLTVQEKTNAFLDRLKSIHTFQGEVIFSTSVVTCMGCNCYFDVPMDFDCCSNEKCRKLICKWCTYKTMQGESVCESCLDNLGE